MQQTILHDKHKQLGACMVEFGGFMMPVQYSNVIQEHMATRKNAGLFDISHMGEFFITGNDAIPFLQTILTNDVERLKNNSAFYSAICNEKGGVIDDLFVYRFSDTKFMIVVNASRIDLDFTHFKQNIHAYNVELENKSTLISKIDIQGPLAEKILQKLTPYQLSELPRFNFVEEHVLGKDVIISRTGYTGEDGFELYIDNDHAVELWDALLLKGKEDGILPVGLGARDTLRIEACYSLYGHELNEETSPIESGIGFVVRPKEVDYIGKDIILKQKEDKPLKHIVYFKMIDKAIPREYYRIFDKPDGEKIADVTSGTYSPLMKIGIGIAFTNNKLEIGDEIYIKVRSNFYKGQIAKRPFYEYKGGK